MENIWMEISAPSKKKEKKKKEQGLQENQVEI